MKAVRLYHIEMSRIESYTQNENMFFFSNRTITNKFMHHMYRNKLIFSQLVNAQ